MLRVITIQTSVPRLVIKLSAIVSTFTDGLINLKTTIVILRVNHFNSTLIYNPFQCSSSKTWNRLFMEVGGGLSDNGGKFSSLLALPRGSEGVLLNYNWQSNPERPTVVRTRSSVSYSCSPSQGAHKGHCLNKSMLLITILILLSFLCNIYFSKLGTFIKIYSRLVDSL